jgi:SNF2 family DNA or RNA helicase
MMLRDYQLNGIKFLSTRDQAILSDQPGLGKTLMALKTVEELGLTALVICPKSIRGEWKTEAKKWTSLKTMVIDGSPKTREFLYRLKSNIYILSYDTAIKDHKLISQLPYDCIILDEAQRIKNRRTLTAKTVKNLRMPPRRYVLTATPIENRIDELYSLIEFIGNGVYDDLQKALLSKRGSYSGYYNTAWGSGSERLRKMVARADPAVITQALSRFMLRRRKEDVAPELPPKTHITIETPLTKEQEHEYKLARDEFLRMVGDKVVPISSILAQLTYLRVLCDSTKMFDKTSGSSSKLDELVPRVKDIVDTNEKVIIFSEYKRMCDKIIHTLRTAGITDISYMHGDNCDTEKEKKAFWEKNRVMVCTKTGEAGHNLQCASYVFHIENNWNPARMEQREDRTHRLGQAKPVIVYEFFCPGTVEEKVRATLEQKRELIETVIDRPEYREWLRSIVE